MTPLLLRGFVVLVLAVGLAIGIGFQLAKPGVSREARHAHTLETSQKLTEIKTRLLGMDGNLQKRMRRLSRAERKHLWLCPLGRGQVLPTVPGVEGERVLFPGRGIHLRHPLNPSLVQSLGRRARNRALCMHIRKPRQLGWTALAALCTGLLLGVLGFVVPLTRRLRRIERVVHRLAGGDLRARTQDDRRDAVGSLARGVDTMGERIEALLVAQRQMHSTVSHELRTPLARLAAAIDLAEDHPNAKLFQGMRTDIEELDLLVDELLTLSRLQDPSARADLADLDLYRLALERMDACERGDQRQLTWVLEAEEGLRIRGDARLLSRALDNLLNNAARHAKTTVALRVSRGDAGMQVEVADDGAGVPEAQRSTVFDPFVSASPGGSAGLGLAICREIADLHQGAIEVGVSDLGGASFRLVLP